MDEDGDIEIVYESPINAPSDAQKELYILKALQQSRRVIPINFKKFCDFCRTYFKYSIDGDVLIKVWTKLMHFESYKKVLANTTRMEIVDINSDEEPEVLFVSDAEDTITPMSNAEDTITPVSNAEDTITPVSDAEDTITPVSDADDTITPVSDAEDTITPVSDAEDTITPVSDAEDTITPKPVENCNVPVESDKLQDAQILHDHPYEKITEHLSKPSILGEEATTLPTTSNEIIKIKEATPGLSTDCKDTDSDDVDKTVCKNIEGISSNKLNNESIKKHSKRVTFEEGTNFKKAKKRKSSLEYSDEMELKKKKKKNKKKKGCAKIEKTEEQECNELRMSLFIDKLIEMAMPSILEHQRRNSI